MWAGSFLLGALLTVSACSGSSGSGDDAGSDGGNCESACSYYHECPDDQDCVDGCCQRSRSCANDVTCQPGGLCIDGRCVAVCLNDLDCPTEASCIFGFCNPFPQEVLGSLTSPAPDEAQTEKTQLKVGIADVALQIPIGVSMWGFGGRLGPRTPYRDTLGGSDSVLDRPRTKAFAFDNGAKRIILVKVPMGCATDFMVSHVAWRVFQETGENYLNRLVLSAPHSHSHPARFWNIFLEGQDLGVLGTGDFSYEIFHALSSTITEAVLGALADLAPARFGYAILDPMDPEGLIHRYRRSEYPLGDKDDTLVVMRIDDLEGNPRGVLVNMAMHGTHLEGTTLSQDAPGGVELIAQQNLQEQTGYPVKVAFLSRSSGDVSPGGDGPGLDDWRKIQEVGVRTWPKIEQLFNSLNGKTEAEIDLDIANLRAPVSRETLGYADDELYDIVGDTDCSEDSDCSSGTTCIQEKCGILYLFGGFQCVGSSDDDIETRHQDGHLSCLFSAEQLGQGRPTPQFSKVRISVLRIGALGLITVPGEPLSEYGRDLTQVMTDAGFEDATILGYSQDHHFYLMHEDNWYQGGYEASMVIWGWREADYYFEKTAELIERFVADGGFTDDNGLKPTWFDFSCQQDEDCGLDPLGNAMVCSQDKFCKVATTASINPGTIIEDVAPQAQRTEMLRFTWMGGHPGVDMPRMTLAQKEGDSWVPALNAAGQAYDDDGFNTMLTYLGDYEDDHSWQLSWEESMRFATGTYRFHVEGRHGAGDNPEAYQVQSGAFELAPSAGLILTGIEMTTTELSGFVLYPAGPTNNDGQSAFGQLQSVGYLRHTGQTAPYLPWPVASDGTVKIELSIQPPNGDVVPMTGIEVNQTGTVSYTYAASRNQEGQETTSSAALPAARFSTPHTAYQGAGEYLLTFTASDADNNQGTLTQTILLD